MTTESTERYYEHGDYARWDPTYSFGPPPGATATAYESTIDRFIAGSQQLNIDKARQAQDKIRQHNRILDGMKAVWAKFQALSPASITAQYDVISQYDNLLTSPANHGATFGYTTDFTPEDAAANLAAISTLNQSIGNATTLDFNKTLQTNVTLAGDYLQSNLELITKPDGIFGFSDKYLSNNFGITRQEIRDAGLHKQLPTLHWIPAPLAVLAADVVHHQNPVHSLNSGRKEVIGAVMRAAKRFYNYAPRAQALPIESTLHVLAECLVAEAHDFTNAPEQVKKGLAIRMHRAARQGNVHRADQLPSESAANIYSMCMDYYRENRLNDLSAKLQTLWQNRAKVLTWLGVEIRT